VLGDFNINYRSLNAQQNIRNYDDHISETSGLPVSEAGCRTVSNNGSGLTPTQNILVV